MARAVIFLVRHGETEWNRVQTAEIVPVRHRSQTRVVWAMCKHELSSLREPFFPSLQ
jgi:hypothetical protein